MTFSFIPAPPPHLSPRPLVPPLRRPTHRHPPLLHRNNSRPHRPRNTHNPLHPLPHPLSPRNSPHPRLPPPRHNNPNIHRPPNKFLPRRLRIPHHIHKSLRTNSHVRRALHPRKHHPRRRIQLYRRPDRRSPDLRSHVAESRQYDAAGICFEACRIAGLS